MRTVAAILFLYILLFNTYGYKLLMYCFEQKLCIAIEQRLNKNEYDEAALFEVKVSLSIPYLNNWVDFERVNGELEHQGIHYKYVKRKIENSFLIVKCIPNESKARFVNEKDAFFKLINDLPAKHHLKKLQEIIILQKHSALNTVKKQTYGILQAIH